MSADHLLPEVLSFNGEKDAPAPDDPLLRILWKYAPDSFYIINREAAMPETLVYRNYTTPLRSKGGGSRTISDAAGIGSTVAVAGEGWRRWIDKPDLLGQLGDLDTAVHEENHGYTSDFAEFQLHHAVQGDDQRTIVTAPDGSLSTVTFQAHYMDRGETRFVPLSTPYPFPAHEIASRIPESLRGGRFNIYVVGTSSTQGEGVFGLLDEFHAYYWSLRTEYDLFGYYKDEMPQTSKTYIGYVTNQIGTLSAWAEFRYFILTYLQYARDVHPDVYRQLMANARFRETFTQIDDRFIEIFNKMVSRFVVELPAYAKTLGVAFQIGTYNSTGGLSTWEYYIKLGTDITGLNWGDYIPVRRELEKPAYIQMAGAIRTRPAPELPPLYLPGYPGR
jgi:hypothetical protein